MWKTSITIRRRTFFLAMAAVTLFARGWSLIPEISKKEVPSTFTIVPIGYDDNPLQLDALCDTYTKFIKFFANNPDEWQRVAIMWIGSFEMCVTWLEKVWNMRKLLQVCPVIYRLLPGLGTYRAGNGVISFELACFSPFSEVGIARNLYKYTYILIYW